MAEIMISFQVDPDLKKAFSLAAEAHNRTQEDLLCEFIQDFIESNRTDAEYDAWFRRQVQIGLDEADEGLLIPGEEVEAEFAARREAAMSKLPKSA
jgi:predicted transcriptional regulator